MKSVGRDKLYHFSELLVGSSSGSLMLTLRLTAEVTHLSCYSGSWVCMPSSACSLNPWGAVCQGDVRAGSSLGLGRQEKGDNRARPHSWGLSQWPSWGARQPWARVPGTFVGTGMVVGRDR